MKRIFILAALVWLPFQMSAQAAQDTIAWQIADSLETTFGQNSLGYFLRNFNDSIFLSGILFHKKDNENLTSFNKGFVRGNAMKEFMGQVLKNIERGAYYNFVNYYQDDVGNYYLIFRYFSQSDGINYHEYLLEVMPDGALAITDIYVYITGEFLSETIRGVYAQLISRFLNEEDLEQSPYNLEMLDKLREVTELFTKGEKDKARKMYDSELSDDFKKERIALLCELKLTDITDSLAYMNILNRMVKESRSRSAIYLVSIDAFFVSGQFDKALGVIDSLYNFTGDPFLDLYRGNICFASGDIDQSKAHFEQLLANFPYLPEAYDHLLTVYYSLDDVDRFLALLNQSLEFIAIDLSSIDAIVQSDYPKLAQLSQYQEWLKEKKADP